MSSLRQLEDEVSTLSTGLLDTPISIERIDRILRMDRWGARGEPSWIPTEDPRLLLTEKLSKAVQQRLPPHLEPHRLMLTDLIVRMSPEECSRMLSSEEALAEAVQGALDAAMF